MKMNFFVRAVIVCGVGILMMAGAQPVAAQGVSVTAFDRTLETLRESVSSLLKENTKINSENLAARARIKALREDLRSLEAETRRLEEKEAAERKKVQTRSGGVEALKLQIVEADEALKRIRDEVAVEQSKFNDLEKEEKAVRQKADALSGDIALMKRAGANSEMTDNAAALKKEHEQLQKDLAGVVNRVQEAKRQWQDMNAAVTAGPQQLEALDRENATLVKAVSETEAELTRINAQLADTQAAFDKMSSKEDADSGRSGRLNAEVKEMTERNRKLESEILKITQSREQELKRLQADQGRPGEQYQARYEELLQRNVDLKFEVDSLRKQMVDMDKKKAGLEAVVYPTP
jgi:DNA repair exonuclease SbcCD ATPase subunit